jgi:hypothetical protein
LPLPIHPPASPHAITLLSHVKGDRSTPLISKPIGAFFDEQVDLYGDKETLRVVHQDIRWSWTELQVSIAVRVRVRVHASIGPRVLTDTRAFGAGCRSDMWTHSRKAFWTWAFNEAIGWASGCPTRPSGYRRP